jgi:hypothetical protein
MEGDIEKPAIREHGTVSESVANVKDETGSQRSSGSRATESERRDEEQASDDTAAAPLEQPSLAKDPFEVGWDGGDSDPTCPRSKPTPTKWFLTFVACFGALNV